MFVKVSSIPFGTTVTLEGVIKDDALPDDLLTAPSLNGFDYTLECSLASNGLKVDCTVKGKIESACDLCGRATIADCYQRLDEIFTEQDPEFIAEENAYRLDKFIQDCIVLSLPRTVKCKPDCKGVCLKCGANLNETTCKCNKMPIGDHNPFGELQDIIKNGGAKNGSTKM